MSTTRQTCPCCNETFEAIPPRRGGQASCPSCGRVVSVQAAPPQPLWYYAHGKQKCGPVSLAELQRLAAAGQLQPTDMLLPVGSARWVAASSVTDLFPRQLGTHAPVQKTAVASLGQVSAGNELSLALGFGRRLLGELSAFFLAPISQTARLVRYARARWRLRSLAREDQAARLALGQRVYETGGGEGSLRARIAALDEEICRLEGAKQSPRAARDERDQLTLQLADQACAQLAPTKSIEVAHGRAKQAGEALRRHEQSLAAAREELPPRGAANWARVVAGYGSACLLLVFVGCLLLPRRSRSDTAAVITSNRSEQELAQAVGWVICGAKITLADGTEIEYPFTSGSCFAISRDGYLLTNQHVVKETWADLRQPGRMQAIEALGKEWGASVTPMVWVFFSKEKYVGRILHVSQDYDLAILKVERSPSPVFRLSAADSPSRGTKVVACGFPDASRVALSDEELLEGRLRQQRVQLAIKAGKRVRVEDYFRGSDFEFDRTEGTVSRPVNEERGPRWIQHDATIHHGNSGGPLLTADGTAVGINTLGNPNTHGVYRSLSTSQLTHEIERYVPGVVWK